MHRLPTDLLPRIKPELEVHRDGSHPGAFQRLGRGPLRSRVAHVPHPEGKSFTSREGQSERLKQSRDYSWRIGLVRFQSRAATIV